MNQKFGTQKYIAETVSIWREDVGLPLKCWERLVCIIRTFRKNRTTTTETGTQEAGPRNKGKVLRFSLWGH